MQEAAYSVLDEVCDDPFVLAEIAQRSEMIIKLRQDDGFTAKFLRNKTSFAYLEETKWISNAMARWKTAANSEYIKRLDKSFYDALSLNSLNVQDFYAVNMWIPLFDLSEDLRNELILLKRMPFHIIARVENSVHEVLHEEILPTFLHIEEGTFKVIGATSSG